MTAREQFLSILHKGGFRDLRAISTDKKISFQFSFMVSSDLSRVNDFLDTYTKLNLGLYVGVAERLHANGRGLKDCGYLRVLFMDLDFKAITEADARAALAQCPFPPTLIVHTGGGLHVYWLLDTPIDLTSGAIHAKQVLLALAKKLGADTAAATPERILRVPDTYNFKYDPAPLVVLETYNEVSYTLGQFLEWLGPLPVIREPLVLAAYKHNLQTSERIEKAKKWLSNRPPAIEGNNGDNDTYIVCCAVTRGHDLGEDDAYVALADWNARCQPPWTEQDLRGKIQSALRYATGQRGELLQSAPERRLTLMRASQIQIAPVHWCWQDRLAFGSFNLLGGREGIGKSMLAYHLAAEITTGRLPGDDFKTAKSVIIAATEDSWEHTIVPRLMAAKADLNKIFRIEVETATGVHGSLVLPKDTTSLQHHILENDVAMVLLDPLMSRLDPKLDSHKDAETRLALEPLSKIAHDTNCVVLGIIHVNKSSSIDPLTMLMGSRAFAAVARSVLFVMADPDNIKARMMGQPKNNLGQSDELPTKLFHIDKVFVGRTEDGDVYTGKLIWDGDTTSRTITDELETTQEGVDRGAIVMAAEYVLRMVEDANGFIEASEVIHKGRKKHNVKALERGRKHAHLESIRVQFQGSYYWCRQGMTKEELIQKLKERETEFKDQPDM